MGQETPQSDQEPNERVQGAAILCSASHGEGCGRGEKEEECGDGGSGSSRRHVNVDEEIHDEVEDEDEALGEEDQCGDHGPEECEEEELEDAS